MSTSVEIPILLPAAVAVGVVSLVIDAIPKPPPKVDVDASRFDEQTLHDLGLDSKERIIRLQQSDIEKLDGLVRQRAIMRLTEANAKIATAYNNQKNILDRFPNISLPELPKVATFENDANFMYLHNLAQSIENDLDIYNKQLAIAQEALFTSQKMDEETRATLKAINKGQFQLIGYVAPLYFSSDNADLELLRTRFSRILALMQEAIAKASQKASFKPSSKTINLLTQALAATSIGTLERLKSEFVESLDADKVASETDIITAAEIEKAQNELAIRSLILDACNEMGWSVTPNFNTQTKKHEILAAFPESDEFVVALSVNNNGAVESKIKQIADEIGGTINVTDSQEAIDLDTKWAGHGGYLTQLTEKINSDHAPVGTAICKGMTIEKVEAAAIPENFMRQREFKPNSQPELRLRKRKLPIDGDNTN